MPLGEVALYAMAALALLQGLWLAVLWGRVELLAKHVLKLQRDDLARRGIVRHR